MARTDTLGNFLTDVAEAIRTKEGTTETITASEFDTRIANLSGGGDKYAPRYISFRGYTGTELNSELQNLDMSNITSTNSMFYGCLNLTELDVSGLTTNNVTNTQNMFRGCSSLSTIDVRGLDFSNVTNFEYMFYECKKAETILFDEIGSDVAANLNQIFYNCTALKEIDVNKINISNVTSFQYLFGSCSSLESIDLSNWVFKETAQLQLSNMFYSCKSLKNVMFPSEMNCEYISMTTMFAYCTALEILDLTNFATTTSSSETYGLVRGCSNLKQLLIPNLTGGSNTAFMFNGCSSLELIDMRSFATTSFSSTTFTSVPATCEIIVKDDTIRDAILAQRSDFTNIKTVAELTTE